MRFLVKRAGGAILLALIAVLLFSSIALAVAAPASISIASLYCFQNVRVAGDQLWYVRFDVSYVAEPTELASLTYLFAVYASGATVPTATVPIYDYQEQVIALYLTPAQAIGTSTTNFVRIMGNPTYFPTLTEGINMRTRSSPIYLFKADLGGIILDDAEFFQTTWLPAPTLLTTQGHLDADGTAYFTQVVPYITIIAPEIFYISVAAWDITRKTFTGSYEATLKAREGPALQGTMQALSDLLGVRSRGWMEFWVSCLAYVTMVALMYTGIQKPEVCLVMGLFLLPGLIWVGLLSWSTFAVIVVIVGVLFGISFILQRFA